jgi:putative DNA methylase
MSTVTPFSLKDAPALIERLLPVQKLSAEVFKERKAGAGQTLTSLGGYWKGRKPLVLNKACILGCLLPATANSRKDLEVFEKLMGMDDETFAARATSRPKPKDILARLALNDIREYFTVLSDDDSPISSPIDWSAPDLKNVKVIWRDDISELDRRRIEVQMLDLNSTSYRQRVEMSQRPEEVDDAHHHIWQSVNGHLGTSASSFPELVEQLGIMRFGRRPKVGDTFSGSGQIPFEAARLGCDVYASDINPVACMLSSGALKIIGGDAGGRESLRQQQRSAIARIRSEIDALGIETDGNGYRARAFLYCIEAVCPQSGWKIPLLSSLIVSKGFRVVADLIPDPTGKRYEIRLCQNASADQLAAAKNGTVRSDGRGQEPYMIHKVGEVEYRTKISTLRGDFKAPGGVSGNQLRLWDVADFKPQPTDIYQERLYAVQWSLDSENKRVRDSEFRAVTKDDLARERIIEDFLTRNFSDWQKKGWIPDMRIEPGVETERLYRERGWTHWHHLFNPRQLLLNALIRQSASDDMPYALGQILNVNCKLSRWNPAPGPGRAGKTSSVFDNQALNTLFNYGCRGFSSVAPMLQCEYKSQPIPKGVSTKVISLPADQLSTVNDLYVTDPPYGDAVKYEEILEFFIAWLRKNPPPEFADWVWDSRRALAIKGQDEDFRRSMVTAYKRMTEQMSDNGLQVIMFTHQSESIWADMANIVWASGLHVTAAWYVVTETESALRDGANVKGTVLLVLRKRSGTHKTTRDDLAWEIQEEVEKQIHDLTGLNQAAKGLYRDANVFEDADIQMAGYAAALRVLTRYAIIDGRDMTAEAIRPRVKGETTFVDGLIEFAVGTANQCLVPQGLDERHWKEFDGVERFYLKLIDLEAKGFKTLDNYQNFAKAFKVRDFRALMGNQKANEARLKSAVELAKSEMSEGAELYGTVLRAVLYAIMELAKEIDGSEVLAHLTLNVPDYYADMTRRERVVEIADYLARHLEALRPEEASAARVLRELVKNQRLG